MKKFLTALILAASLLALATPVMAAEQPEIGSGVPIVEFGAWIVRDILILVNI